MGRTCAPTSAASSRFNGAPTSRSGMGRGPCRGPSRCRCFNGAPTSRSGMALILWTQSRTLVLQRSPDLAVGDGTGSTIPRPRPPRFNGAPTSRSGMGALRSSLPLSDDCFNGAPTSRSGMGPAVVRHRLAVEPASTEPRPRGRGWYAAGAADGATYLLQRSPDLAVGDGASSRSDRSSAASMASTEPRPRGRGWGRRSCCDLIAVRCASTEPRPRGRGWAERPARELRRVLLQRSPDLAVGDGKARRADARPRWRGFNGAPTSRSGMG